MITASQISQYWRTMVFDCDGVLLNSNEIKSDAFYRVALRYGEQEAGKLRQFHIENGGISRYVKFKYFLSEIISRKDILEDELEALSKHYAQIVQDEVMQCQVTEKLEELRIATENVTWVVVSGSDETELRDIFERRKIAHFFDGGIFGSPDDKETIIAREMLKGNIEKPAVFFGDSSYDHEVAVEAGLDFFFVSDWSEAKESFKSFGNTIPRLSALL